MRLSLFEDHHVEALHPLTATRAAFELRLGPRTLREWIASRFGMQPPSVEVRVREEIEEVVRERLRGLSENGSRAPGPRLFVNARYVPVGSSLGLIQDTVREQPAERRLWTRGDSVVAAYLPDSRPPAESSVPAIGEADGFADWLRRETAGTGAVELEDAVLLDRLSDLVRVLPRALRADARSYAESRTEEWKEDEAGIWCAPSATVRSDCVLDPSGGPIVVDAAATVEWKSILEGPVYVGPGSIVRPGATLDTVAVGPVCKIGGELAHSVVHSYSNKAHDGFLGHSYLGSWCNLGAHTTTSNLRNDYAPVPLYDPMTESQQPTEETFLGLFMGDHSKTGVQTRFNTGSVVGVFCNVYGTGYQPRHIPSFSWGGGEEFERYRFETAEKVARRVMARRDVDLSRPERDLLLRIHDEAARVHFSDARSTNGRPAASTS